jgi:uncharacterized protein YcsI (UPF0317 family)
VSVPIDNGGNAGVKIASLATGLSMGRLLTQSEMTTSTSLSGSVMMSHRAVPELNVAEAGLGGIRPEAAQCHGRHVDPWLSCRIIGA